MIWIYLSIAIVAFLVVRKSYRRYKVRKVAKEIWRDHGTRLGSKPQAFYFHARLLHAPRGDVTQIMRRM